MTLCFVPNHLPVPISDPEQEEPKRCPGSRIPPWDAQGYPPAQTRGTHRPARAAEGAGVNQSGAGHAAAERLLLSVAARAFKRCCLPGLSPPLSLQAAAFRPLFGSRRMERWPPAVTSMKMTDFHKVESGGENAVADELPARRGGRGAGRRGEARVFPLPPSGTAATSTQMGRGDSVSRSSPAGTPRGRVDGELWSPRAPQPRALGSGCHQRCQLVHGLISELSRGTGFR